VMGRTRKLHESDNYPRRAIGFWAPPSRKPESAGKAEVLRFPDVPYIGAKTRRFMNEDAGFRSFSSHSQSRTSLLSACLS